jgi:hypothetical protein
MKKKSVKKKSVIALLGILASLTASSAFADSELTCVPAETNGYFTENVSLRVVNSRSIKVNKVVLDLDANYRPRYPTRYKHYIGDTDEATQWSDSGLTEVFYDGATRLKFTIRGEMYISETFKCKAAR